MAPPSAAPYPAEHPAARPVSLSLSVSLPLHPDHLFHPAQNAKTREAQGLAGFGQGAFLPLTFLLCHKQKNKSRTFLKNMGERITDGMEDVSNLRSLRAGYRPCSTFGLKSLHWSDFFTASAFKL
ncbi:hypothetical protein [Thalassospira lucentensis]|uniref:hypothetical protein n=1 Tax=Thalassospira lucentensis TaxID=168935 RepID=UPI002942F872|nr:hypothetical protein [Thalassospira lucentensis]WOI11147.1 hypothetical protein R1T41_21930 [Thalassospira lucentensis]